MHDLAGNVTEWSQDWYDGTQTVRAVRGSNWSGKDRGPQLSTHRAYELPDSRGIGRGFRCVLCVLEVEK